MLRIILPMTGGMLLLLAICMIPPMLFDFFTSGTNWKTFLYSIIIILIFAFLIRFLESKGDEKTNITTKGGFLFIASSWIIMSFFSSLPLHMSGINYHYIDSLFETVSGITGTGATIFQDIEILPPGILLWRVILNWLGGIGITIFAVAVLTTLNLGGTHGLQTEIKEYKKNFLLHYNETAYYILIVYGILTILCFLSMKYIAGINTFDALCHTFSTVSTGGFGNYNDSIAAFQNSKLEYIIMIFMIFGSLPFTLYMKLILERNLFKIQIDEQVKIFLAIIAMLVGITLIYHYAIYEEDTVSFEEILRTYMFNIIAIITTTGYSTINFAENSNFIIFLFIIAILIGGCSGSTSGGGVKMYRAIVLYKHFMREMKILIQPHKILKVRYNNHALMPQQIITIHIVLFAFLLTFFILTSILIIQNLSLADALSTSLVSLTNLGPGFTENTFNNYAFLTNGAKFTMILGMIIGRLEILGILVLVMPSFWRE